MVAPFVVTLVNGMLTTYVRPSLLVITAGGVSGPMLVVAHSSPSISVNALTGVITFLDAGYYLVDWPTGGSAAVFDAANAALTLTRANHQVYGPLA